MPFQKMQQTKYPPRFWGLSGYPGSGKSTFLTRMKSPILAIDSDHRFTEVLRLNDNVYQLSDVPTDNVDTDRIAELLMQNMPGSGVATIGIDSLTAIIVPLVIKALRDKDSGKEANLAAALRVKALAMRQLQDAVTRWGCDTLWIYHMHDARDAKGKELTKATVSATELIRLTRSLNMQLQVMQDGDRRGIKVAWARRGRSGMTLWDDAGDWRWMPEKIEAAVYDGLSEEEQRQIEQSVPSTFASPEVAVAWAMDRKAFESVQHARNAYEKIKREHQPANAREMAALWTADVIARQATNGSQPRDPHSGSGMLI